MNQGELFPKPQERTLDEKAAHINEHARPIDIEDPQLRRDTEAGGPTTIQEKFDIAAKAGLTKAREKSGQGKIWPEVTSEYVLTAADRRTVTEEEYRLAKEVYARRNREYDEDIKVRNFIEKHTSEQD